MKTVLLIIDMQNDFVEEGTAITVKGIKYHLNKFKSFIDNCRDKDIAIIYTKHIFDQMSNPIEAKLFPMLIENGLKNNTKGIKICDKLKPMPKDIIIKKRRYDAFIGTNLEIFLRTRGI